MHFERRMAVADSGTVETLGALLDAPFAICSIVTDARGQAADIRFLRVSANFPKATGFEAPEGRTLLEVAPGIDRKWIELCGRVALDRASVRFTEHSTRGRPIEVAAAPLDPPGCFAVTFRPLAEPKGAEAGPAADLDHAQHLLRELGHRVMNSFAALSATLAMETRAAPPEAREPLERMQGRVQALAALYRRLDTASPADRIEAADYLGGNIRSFRDSLAEPAGIAITSDLAPMTLSTQAAMPLALVANELLLNALKHAFAPGQTGAVHVSLSEEDGLCRLVVEDDGGGLAGTGSGLGRSLVEAFVAELGGELATETGPAGTRVTVTFRA